MEARRADDGTGRAGRRGSPAAAGHSLQRLPAVFLLKDTRAASGAPFHPPNATAAAAKGSGKAATHAPGNPHWIKSARQAGSGRRSQGQWAVSLNTPQGTQCRKKNYVLLKSGIHPSFPSHVLSSNIWKEKKLTIQINSEKIVTVCQRLIVGSVPQDPRTHKKKPLETQTGAAGTARSCACASSTAPSAGGQGARQSSAESETNPSTQGKEAEG